MKRLILIALVGITLFSCNQKKVTTLETQNQELKEAAAEKDSSIIVFMEAFNDIESNLAEIRERELNISLQGKENGRTSEDIQNQIKKDIQAINELINQNKETIEELNTQLATTKGKNTQLNKMLISLKESLNQQITAKDEQIALLKEDLSKMNFTVEELNADLDTLKSANLELAEMNTEKESIIEERTDELNTAYLALGTKKELEEEQIISKEGGFLGIGKTDKLNDNLDPQRFEKIDIRETLSIPVSGKKVELITSHPSESYRIVGEEQVEKIEILNPEDFWNNSKYLVVSIN